MEVIRREATLFIKSKCSENYKTISDILTKNKEYPSLTTKEFEKLENEQKELIKFQFRELFSLAIQEWRRLGTVEKNNNPEIACQLCGHKPIVWLSHIKNINTNEELIVGSTCIDEYDQLKGINGESADEIKAKNQRIINEQVLNKESPGFLKDCNEFRKIRKRNILVRNDLSKKYNLINTDLEKRMKLLSSAKKLTKKQIELIKSTHESIKQAIEIFEAYFEFSENDDFGINSNITEWLRKNYDYEEYAYLQEHGKVDRYSIAFIKEHNFMRRMLIKLKPMIECNDMIMGETFTNTEFTVAYKSNNIMLNLNSNEFIKLYRDFIFTQKYLKIEVSFIIKNSRISTADSLKKALKYFKTKNIKNEYYEYYSDIKTNELAFCNNISKKIFVVGFYEMINFFKNDIIRDQFINIDDALKYIKEKSEVYETIKEYNDHINKMNR